jgi:hypothetical protein
MGTWPLWMLVLCDTMGQQACSIHGLTMAVKHTYIGVLDKHGYQVTIDGKPLPLHALYCTDRDWNTANGLRQLALDLLIDVLDEHPTTEDLERREEAVAAWLPHLLMPGTLLASIITVHPKTPGEWRLTDQQIRAWLLDWMFEQHQHFCRDRYSGRYLGIPYEPWYTQLRATVRELSALSLAQAGMNQAWRYKAYITGYLVEDLVIMWCKLRFIDLNTRLAEATQV